MSARTILFTLTAALSLFTAVAAHARTVAGPTAGVLDDCIRPNICDFMPHLCDDDGRLPEAGREVWSQYGARSAGTRLDMAVGQLRSALQLRPFEVALLDRLAYAPDADADAEWAALEDIRLRGLDVNPGSRLVAGAVRDHLSRAASGDPAARSDGGAANVISGAGLALAVVVAVADGPLPFGDAVAAVIIGGLAGKAINDALEEA